MNTENSSSDEIEAKRRRKWTALAGISGALSVLLGALGAHGPVADHLAERGANSVSSWETAVTYHLLHSVVLLLWSIRPRWLHSPIPGILIFCGTLGFSGSLYFLAAFGTKWLGPVTPAGGILLIAGWLWIAFHALRTGSKVGG